MESSTSLEIRSAVADFFPNTLFGNCDRLYNCTFNMTHQQIVWLYLRIKFISGDYMDAHWRPCHLLWTLNYLKVYPTFDAISVQIGFNHITVKKWILYTVVELLSNLEMVRLMATFFSTLTTTQIDFDNRKLKCIAGQTAFVTLDGVDFSTHEHYPFDDSLYSHKLNGPGIRYDVALCINTGDIVFWGGGFKAGVYPDLVIARKGICLLLEPYEKILADKGYEDARYFIYPATERGDNALLKNISGRHENINARLKCWGVLRQKFRGTLSYHYDYFSAIIQMEQFKLKHGNKMQKISLHAYNI